MDSKALEDLKKQIKNCKRCTLYASCKGKVFGDIGINTKVVLIGEGPGADEDMSGRPFVGPAGQLLRSWMKIIGVGDSEMSILNVVCCRPPNNRTPLEVEVDACSKRLDQQLNLIGCNKIVLLGRTACARMLPEFDGTVLKDVGKIFTVDHRQMLVMPHPSFVMRGGNRYPVPLDKLQKFIGD